MVGNTEVIVAPRPQKGGIISVAQTAIVEFPQNDYALS
jgi:hypothetical protein